MNLISKKFLNQTRSMMMRACQIQSQGELDVIKVIDIPKPVLNPFEVLYKVEYAGVNYIDTYQRSGIYALPMPFTLGNESSGVVVEVGESVSKFKLGDRVVAYTAGGGFAEFCKSSESKTALVPTSISLKDASTMLLSGLTAITQVTEAHNVKKLEFILIFAAAGGLGQLLCQICHSKGAIVIGIVSTKEKAQIAKQAGADHVLLSTLSDEEIISKVFEITGGEGIDRGVHCSFDSIGKDTLELSLAVLRRKGSYITCGNASGPVAAFAPLRLGAKNLKMMRPILNQSIHTLEEFNFYTLELFKLIESGSLNLSRWIENGYEFSTEGIKQSQIDIMSRKTSGKLIIKINT